MGEFDDILGATLKNANEKFNEARRDLNNIVSEVASAVTTKTKPNFGVELKIVAHSATHLIYQLQFIFRGNRQSMGLYALGSQGYPIEFGTNATEQGMSNPDGQLKDLAEITQHFQEMLKNPDSPLMVQIAFEMRKEGQG